MTYRDALSPDQIDDLARRAQDGDARAMEDLLSAVRPRALAVCMGVLPHAADAEDACQETLISITKRIGSWRRRGHFTTWLHVVAVNASRSSYRTMKRQATPSDQQRLEVADPRTTSVIAGTRLDLLEAMETIEQNHPTLVEPLLLRDVYGLSYDEIARSLEVPLGTIKARIHRGRKQARSLLRAKD